MMPHIRTQRGFTLLEVLVAIGIFAIFSALAYGSLTRLLEARDRIEQERLFWRELALAFAQLEDDLASVRPRTIRDVYGNPLPAFRGLPVDPRAQGEPALAFTRGGVFVLSDSRRPDLLRVGYRLQENRLMRLTWPALDQPVQERPQSVVLLQQLREMRVRFFVAGGGWVDSWPPPDGKLTMLPAAVEMTLTLDGRGQFVRVLRVGS